MRIVLLVPAATIALTLPSLHAVLANDIEQANVTPSCTGYTLSATGRYLSQTDTYAVQYLLSAKGGNQSPITASGTITIPPKSQGPNGTFSVSTTKSFGPLSGGPYTLSGTATLKDVTQKLTDNTVNIGFTTNPLVCSTTPTCTSGSSNVSNFNGTPIQPGSYIWFNANFQPSGVPAAGATLYFRNQTLNFTAGGKSYAVSVPDSEIVFSSSTQCPTTSYDAGSNMWITTVPAGQSQDEIFLGGLAYPAPASFGKVSGNVTWNGTFETNASGLGGQWKWGAAVYSQFTTDYNSLAVKPVHQYQCTGAFKNGDHAGSPEGTAPNGTRWAKYVVGGARGGGGANVTGSWSGTVRFSPVCKAP